MFTIHKVKHKIIENGYWVACLLLAGVVLAPVPALAASETYAVSCPSSNVKLVDNALGCGASPALPQIEGIGSVEHPYPSDSGVATVNVTCRSSTLKQSLVLVGAPADFKCKNGSSPSFTSFHVIASLPPAPIPVTAPPPSSCNITKCDLVTQYIQPIINLLAGVVGIIVVISLILGGIEYSTSEGDPQKSAKAKRRIANTLFALLAFFFLYAFLQFLIPNGLFSL
jgi:hypothetical protein